MHWFHSIRVAQRIHVVQASAQLLPWLEGRAFDCSKPILPFEDDKMCPMIQWLRKISQSLPMVPVAGVPMAGPDAVMAGWESLKDVMRSMEVRFREQFTK